MAQTSKRVSVQCEPESPGVADRFRAPMRLDQGLERSPDGLRLRPGAAELCGRFKELRIDGDRESPHERTSCMHQ